MNKAIIRDTQETALCPICMGEMVTSLISGPNYFWHLDALSTCRRMNGVTNRREAITVSDFR